MKLCDACYGAHSVLVFMKETYNLHIISFRWHWNQHMYRDDIIYHVFFYIHQWSLVTCTIELNDFWAMQSKAWHRTRTRIVSWQNTACNYIAISNFSSNCIFQYSTKHFEYFVHGRKNNHNYVSCTYKTNKNDTLLFCYAYFKANNDIRGSIPHRVNNSKPGHKVLYTYHFIVHIWRGENHICVLLWVFFSYSRVHILNGKANAINTSKLSINHGSMASCHRFDFWSCHRNG